MRGGDDVSLADLEPVHDAARYRWPDRLPRPLVVLVSADGPAAELEVGGPFDATPTRGVLYACYVAGATRGIDSAIATVEGDMAIYAALDSDDGRAAHDLAAEAQATRQPLEQLNVLVSFYVSDAPVANVGTAFERDDRFCEWIGRVSPDLVSAPGGLDEQCQATWTLGRAQRTRYRLRAALRGWQTLGAVARSLR